MFVNSFDTTNLLVISKNKFRNLNKENKNLELIDNYVSDNTLQIEEMLRVTRTCLLSKQNKEIYENLLADCLGLNLNPLKHGFDAFSQDDSELYEFKPCSKKGKEPSGTINDDSLSKIQKYENELDNNKKVWIILAKINNKEFTFDSIYKFNAEIYIQDRKDYIHKIIQKNKEKKNKQTRICYPINVKNSITLSEKYNQNYYYWTNSNISI
jgi:hypothetical protein